MSEPSVAADPTVAVEEDHSDEAVTPEASAESTPQADDDWSDPATHETLDEDHQPVAQAPTEAGFAAVQPGSPVSILPEGAYIEYLES